MRSLLALSLMATLLCLLPSGVSGQREESQPRSREQINAGLNRERNGVYFLTESTFDDFINYNDLVLICFYETGDLEPVLSEMLVAISRRVQDQSALFEVAMVAVDRAPMLEARYHPVTVPDFRIYYKANNIKYYGKQDLEQLTDWTMRKIGLPNNRISSLHVLKKKLEKSTLLVIFIADPNEASRHFTDYLEVSRKLLTLDDVEFAFLYPADFGNDLSHLERVTKSPFYKQFEFGIRVYRRGNLADIKDMNRWSLASEDSVTQTDIENFIFRSTFVGDGPDFIREANEDNMMKFFSQNQPGLLLFYNSELVKAEKQGMLTAIESLEKVFDEISGRIIVAKVDVTTLLGKKLAQVTNIDQQEALEYPFLRIVDPNQAHQSIEKYRPEGLTKEQSIEPSRIKDFVNDFVGKRLDKFLKTQPNPRAPTTMKLPILALNTDTFRALMKDEAEKDIFMFFGGPACFSCPQVWPEFEKIVRVLHEKSSSIIFAFVDLSHNELQEEAKIYAFPTLRLYPGGTDRSRTWLGFTQNPSYSLLLSFLKEHTTAGELVEDIDQLYLAIEEEKNLNDALAGNPSQEEKDSPMSEEAPRETPDQVKSTGANSAVVNEEL